MVWTGHYFNNQNSRRPHFTHLLLPFWHLIEPKQKRQRTLPSSSLRVFPIPPWVPPNAQSELPHPGLLLLLIRQMKLNNWLEWKSIGWDLLGHRNLGQVVLTDNSYSYCPIPSVFLCAVSCRSQINSHSNGTPSKGGRFLFSEFSCSICKQPKPKENKHSKPDIETHGL